MKSFAIILVIISLVFSCGQVQKEVATDQILGEYSGTATFIYKHSLQNVGIDDETLESKGTISIVKNSANEIFIMTGDGGLKISGITLASNGTLFNIPYQKVVTEEKEVINVQGFQTSELEGIKFDGIYNSDINSLNFGYETVMKYNYLGTFADVSVMCFYEFSKMN
jgi:hypothetical protein